MEKGGGMGERAEVERARGVGWGEWGLGTILCSPCQASCYKNPSIEFKLLMNHFVNMVKHLRSLKSDQIKNCGFKKMCIFLNHCTRSTLHILE